MLTSSNELVKPVDFQRFSEEVTRIGYYKGGDEPIAGAGLSGVRRAACGVRRKVTGRAARRILSPGVLPE